MQKSNIGKSLFLIMIWSKVYASPDAQVGWFFYEKPLKVESQNAKPIPQFNNYKQLLDQAKAEYEEVEAKAILDPTPENIMLYRQAMQVISDRSAKLALLATTQNWQDPNSRISLQATGGAGLQQDLDSSRRDVADLVKRFGIFYFFSANCKYCSLEANEVKRLELNYGINIKAVSMDGSNLKQFPNALPDKGFSTALGVKKPGALVALDVVTGKSVIIGYGYMHYDAIIERLHTLFVSGTAYPEQYLNGPIPEKITQ